MIFPWKSPCFISTIIATQAVDFRRDSFGVHDAWPEAQLENGENVIFMGVSTGVGIDVPFWGFWTSPNQIFVGYCIPNSRVMWNIGTFGNRCSIVIPCVFVDLLEITYWIVWFLLLSMWFRIRSLELWFCCCKYVFGRFVIESLVSLGVLCSHMNKTWVYLCGFLIPGLGLVQAPTNKKCAP